VIAGSVARRYARALIEVAAEDDHHERVGKELEAVAHALAVPEARHLLANPSFSEEQRRELAEALGKELRLSPLSRNFLAYLVDRQRLGSLEMIARVYGDLLDKKVGRVRAVVTSALPLEHRDLNHVREALEKATDRTVVLEAKTDPAIVGGLVTQVGAMVYDGSLKTQLERLRDELKQAGE